MLETVSTYDGCWTQKKISFFIYLRRGMLHIYLVTFTSFILVTKIHLFISYTKVQLIHFVIGFHLIDFTDHSPSHSHSPYCIVVQLYCVFHFFNQSRHWKRGVSLDKILIGIIYCIIEAEL